MKFKIYILIMHFIFPFLFYLCAYAQEPLNIQSIPQNEPSIIELHQAAIKYAEVSPRKITSWRRQAAIKALLPEVSVGYDKDIYRTVSSYNYKGDTTFTIGPDDLSYGWDLSLKWDLSELIYNHDQTTIDSRSKLMVQLRNNILEQLNQAYFQRKRLKRELNQCQDKTSQSYFERELKIEELTATIDALTGGYLNRKMGREN